MSKIRSEEEITEKRKECFFISRDMQQDKATMGDAAYYSGAWHALMWVLEEEEDI